MKWIKTRAWHTITLADGTQLSPEWRQFADDTAADLAALAAQALGVAVIVSLTDPDDGVEEPAPVTYVRSTDAADLGSPFWQALDPVLSATVAAGVEPVAEQAKLQTNTVIIFGDSITAQNLTGTSTLDPATASVAGRGYWNWANAYLFHRGTLVRNAGIGGNTTAQMLARIDADVLAYDSDWVIVCAGANDVSTDVSSATTIANLTAILDALQADGRRVLITTVPPSANYNTSGRRAALTAVNKWINLLPLTRRGVAVADVWRVLADPTTGSPATGMAIDAVHPSDMGAMRMGKAIANVLDPLMTRRPYRTLGLLDSDNVMGGSLASSSGWTTLGTGVTPTYGLAADDRWSKKASLAFAGISDNGERGITYVENISGGRFAVGDVVQAVARFKWSGATPVGSGALFAPYIRIYPREVGGAFGTQILGFNTASGEYQTPVGNDTAAGEATSMTFRGTIPANIDRLYIAVGFRGMASGTVEISDLSVWKNA